MKERGAIVAPAVFPPAAERYNMMPNIDRWVVRTAFRHLREGRLLTHRHDRRISINISGQSLSDERFLKSVVDQIHASEINARKICFEITETAVIANMARATQFIASLKELGCCVALDDFGSGLSSFPYLKKLPVDFLKIDGGFVRDLLDEPIDHSMVEAINQIGHVIGIQTIAEFVESDTIRDRLRTLGVDSAQRLRYRPANADWSAGFGRATGLSAGRGALPRSLVCLRDVTRTSPVAGDLSSRARGRERPEGRR